MHMADALISTPVALTTGVVAAALIGVAGYRVNKEKNVNARMVPLMGILGAFVFAAQMINFTIPGTGSSGHIIGGILLAAFLGPWAAFLTLSSVLIIQCLIFADGGLMALGCNIINMAAMTTLVAYPVIFRPLIRRSHSIGVLSLASIISCIAGLELGACGVAIETFLSGVTALPFKLFLGIMTGIHLAIGAGEGLATLAILAFVVKSRPDLLMAIGQGAADSGKTLKKVLIGFGVATVVLGGGLAFFASEYPDGLEWSIQKITGSTELEVTAAGAAVTAEKVQTATSIMPEYDSNFSGILGALIVIILIWSISALFTRKKSNPKSEGRQD